MFLDDIGEIGELLSELEVVDRGQEELFLWEL